MTFIIKPKTSPLEQVSFGQWIKNHLNNLLFGNQSGIKFSITPKGRHLEEALREALLLTYPCDGFDVKDHKITGFNGEVYPYDGHQSFLALFLTSFFGLPNRPVYKNLGWTLDPFIVMFNFFGGWDFHADTDKSILQYLAVIVKVTLIFPIKLITLPLKFLLNVVKLFTEALPTFASFFYASLIYRLQNARHDYKLQDSPLQYMATAGLVALSFLHTIMKLFSVLGRAITSPEKSARLAYAFAHEVKGEGAKVLAFLSAAFSVALSAALWAVTLPVFITVAQTYAPTLTNTILQWLWQLTTLPVVAPTLNLLNGFINTTVMTLNVVFAPVATALSQFIGVTVSAEMLALGTALGVFVQPLATIGSRVADVLSNTWVSWHKGGPISGGWFRGCSEGKSSGSTKNFEKQLSRELKDLRKSVDKTVSQTGKELKNAKRTAKKEVQEAAAGAERVFSDLGDSIKEGGKKLQKGAQKIGKGIQQTTADAKDFLQERVSNNNNNNQ